jgi:hypothetical protein
LPHHFRVSFGGGKNDVLRHRLLAKYAKIVKDVGIKID